MNILDKLWSGKILPCEQFVRGSGEYFDALHSAADAKEQLLAELPPDIREKVEAKWDTQQEAGGIAERRAFVAGFRLAAQLIIAALQND